MSSKKLICIVGASGSGKDVCAKYLENKYNVPQLVSYTTREMRDGETDGVEHFFVNESDMPPRCEMMAYTLFGGNHYWTSKQGVRDMFDKSDIITYNIDEDGVNYLLELSERDESLRYFEIIPINIKVSIDVRLSRGVDPDRIARDDGRKSIKIPYHYTIMNNNTIKDFYCQIDAVIKNIKK